MAITTINGRTMGTTIKEIPSPDRTFLFTGSVDDLPDKGAEGDMAYCLGGEDAGKVFRFSEAVLDWVPVESGGGLPPISRTVTEILAESSVEFESEHGLYYGTSPGASDISAGDVLTVYWDGEAYECPAVAAPDVAEGAVVFGDSNNTGELPFAGVYVPADQSISWVAHNMGPHTVSISKVAQSPADGYILGVDNGEWKAIPNEGGGDVLYVEDIEDETTGDRRLSISRTEFLAAIDAGKMVILKIPNPVNSDVTDFCPCSNYHRGASWVRFRVLNASDEYRYDADAGTGALIRATDTGSAH